MATVPTELNSDGSKASTLAQIASVSAKSPARMLNFRQNPIAKAEFRHQRHVLNTSRSGIFWIILASIMLIPAILYGMVMYGAVLFGFNLPSVDQYTLFGQVLSWLFVMLLTMNFALYGVVTLITLGLSAQSITREKSGGTWDTLVLTNIDARTIVLGKWWASLRALWGDHFMVLLLRLGILGQVLLFIRQNAGNLPLDVSVGVALVIPATLLIIAITVLDAAFTVALGVAIPLSNAGGGLVIGAAATMRILGFIGLIYMAWDLGGRLVNGETWFLVGVLWVIGFIIATWLSLYMAEWLAVRGQVSAPDDHDG